ncbi:MAG: hypothetical protein K1X75_06090 [Leptospirales bacterium]|nr:hypothetical protein [Leptospirales bacterium]
MGYAPPPRRVLFTASIVAWSVLLSGCIGIVDQGIEPNKNEESFPAYPTSSRRLWIPYLPPTPPQSAPDNLDAMTADEQQAAEEAIAQFGFCGLQTAEGWQEQSLPAMNIDELKALRRYLASALVIAETSRLNNDPEYGIPEEIFELSIENLLAYRTKVNEELRRRGVHRIE